ncbi:MAG: hypothetical protein A2W99_14250 [Bacteroidetes bacterium GWF2_33_16]|nr:MAG: hypothetical protein A2X00_06180 [Bacteroidetes bacterium GWE2_32_14]OFY04787.1 MAG: hypothetical protein A2W99_14250 [Bacteroidetes bacterium GWF2_33_16]
MITKAPFHIFSLSRGNLLIKNNLLNPLLRSIFFVIYPSKKVLTLKVKHMKRICITTLLLTSLSFSLFAQFLMKSDSHILQVGDEHYFNLTNNVDAGKSGAAIVWDFSKLETKSQLTSYMYDVAKTANGLDIPEANTVLEEFGVKFFFRSNGNIMEQYGTVTANTISKYDKPFVKMVFPFDYGDIYSGDFSGTIEGPNFKQPIEGTYSLEADAYGTLIIPTGIYTNVLRIKTYKEEHSKGSSCNCGTISYKWYSKDIRYPLLTIIQTQNSNGTATIRTAYYSKYKLNEVVDKENLNLENISASIYPNPFTESFKIDYYIQKDSPVEIVIFDNSGRKVSSIQRNSQAAGYYTETFTKEQLDTQQGLFHIRITAGDETISKTVIRGGE